MKRINRRTAVLAGTSLAASLLLGGSAHAADTVDMEKAKAEGKVVWYTSTPVKTAQELAKQFEAKTGIQVELFRSGGSAIMRRFMQEAQAGRHAADVMTTSDPALALEADRPVEVELRDGDALTVVVTVTRHGPAVIVPL